MKARNILFLFSTMLYFFFFFSYAQPYADIFKDKTKYPDIVAPSKDPAIEKAFELLRGFGCTIGSSFGPTFDTLDVELVKVFQKENDLSPTGEIHADTWKALSSGNPVFTNTNYTGTSSKSCPKEAIQKLTPTSQTGGQTGNTNVTQTNTAQESDYYVNVSSFDGTEGTKTTFSNTSTGSMSTVFNYLLTLMAVAIVVLVIFRVLQGAVIKGTFDNIYNQMKGKSMIQNAGKALFVFILVYAVLTFINPDLVNWTLDTSYKADLSKSPYANSGGGSCPVDPYAGKSLREIIIFNETSGRMINYVNLDTKNIPTIGFGFNLQRNGAKASLIKAGVSEAKATQLVNATKEDKSLTLDDATIYKLLDQDIQDKKNEATNYFKKEGIDFSTLPANIQNVIVDMMFNVGAGGFDQFTKFKAAVKIKDWNEASRQITDSNYCSQVKSRCYRNAALVSPGCGGALNTNTSSQSSSGSISSQTKQVLGIRSPQISKEDAVVVCGITVNKKIEQDIKDLCTDMKAAGFDPTGSYGWRSCEKQKQLYADNCGNGTRKCQPKTAVPCTSNHGAGLAIDIKINGGRSICYATKGLASQICTPKEQAAFDWLKQNAATYHLYNLPSEKWHWSTTGR